MSLRCIPIWFGEKGTCEAELGFGGVSGEQTLPITRVVTFEVFEQERGGDFFRLFVGREHCLYSRYVCIGRYVERNLCCFGHFFVVLYEIVGSLNFDHLIRVRY